MSQTPTANKRILSGTPLVPFVLVTSMFMFWGIANNMTDTLLAAFKRILSISDLGTSIIQFVFYGAYFLLAIPAAIITKKYSYKAGLLIGLGLFAAGGLLFYPASKTMEYGHFLAALFILAGGLSLLETAANPYVVAMGDPETGTQRLNLAQSFNPVGSITGVVLSKLFILSQLNQATEADRAAMSTDELHAIQAHELAAVVGPYAGIAVILLIVWLLIAFTKMPSAGDSGTLDFFPTFRRLFKRPNWVWGVIAQFFYVGAQICVWSFIIRYVMMQLGVNEDEASNYYLASLVAFLLSRFICTYLMKFIDPKDLLGWLAVGGAVFCLTVMFTTGWISVIALIAISACMSLMFPTIYGLGIEELGEDTKIGGSGLIMAILGGAVLPPLMGLVSDSMGIAFAYIVPFCCFLVIVYYGFVAAKKHGPANLRRRML